MQLFLGNARISSPHFGKSRRKNMPNYKLSFVTKIEPWRSLKSDIN
jgi:hypothetical protein